MQSKKRQNKIVGVIPGGTANLWTGDVGIPGDPVQAALALINSKVHQVDLGRVTIQNISFPESSLSEQAVETEVHRTKKVQKKLNKKIRNHFLLMAGLGFDAAVMETVSKQLKEHIGPLAVGISALKHLGEQPPFPVEIRAFDGQKEVASWKGNAIQLIFGNTRRYAIFLETTPNSYIDDGVLDAFVVTADHPLSTAQQVSGLLFHRQPDTRVSQTFRGTSLHVTVPASIALEIDGSRIKLKDLLAREYADQLKQIKDLSQVLVTYCFESLPHALRTALPPDYDDTLFEYPQHEREHAQLVDEIVGGNQNEGEETKQDGTDEDGIRPGEYTSSEEMEKLRRISRSIEIVGSTVNPQQPGSYILAGTLRQASTGDLKPVALVATHDTVVLDKEGKLLEIRVLEGLKQNNRVLVQGKKTKRNVIRATCIVLLQ